MESDDSVLGKAILGGVEIPDVNGVMGYGPVRYLLPAEVREICAALAEFPIETNAREFDADKADLARVYVPPPRTGRARAILQLAAGVLQSGCGTGRSSASVDFLDCDRLSAFRYELSA